MNNVELIIATLAYHYLNTTTLILVPTSMMKSDRHYFVHGENRVHLINQGGSITLVINGVEQKPDPGIDLETTAKAKMRELYKEFFKKQFKYFVVLTGAGSSIGIGGERKGMSMPQLWLKAKDHMGAEKFDQLCKEVGHSIETNNLETLLSQLEGKIKYGESAKVYHAESGEDAITTPSDTIPIPLSLADAKFELLSLIRSHCNLDAPISGSDFPHKEFLSKVTQRKATLPRVRLFTLNYDLLFEKASTSIGAVVMDGFSFTMPRTFSGRNFDYDVVQREKSRLKDEDNFIPRLFHLYKLHGSLNWERNEDAVVINEGATDPLMIYPRESKYEYSYEQPFFEMMARFQQCLRKSDAVLLCIGYSFNDKHVNAAIEEALNQNPGFQLVVVNPDFEAQKGKFEVLIEQAKSSQRVIMIDERFSDFTSYFPEIQTYNNLYDQPFTKLT